MYWDQQDHKVVPLQLNETLNFLRRHPECFWNIVVLSGVATLAQLFISHTIRTFGALLFATVMTTREFTSILLSCVLFLQPLSWRQMASTCVVIGALYCMNVSAGKKHAAQGGVEGAMELKLGKDAPRGSVPLRVYNVATLGTENVEERNQLHKSL